MSNRGIQFLSVEDVIRIHDDSIVHDGGSPGIRDRGLLESAVMMPAQQYGGAYLHPSIGAMAAAYLFHIANNHPFVDGNKRAGVMSAIVFLYVNDVALRATPDDLERITLAVADGSLSKDGLIAWFRSVTGETD